LAGAQRPLEKFFVLLNIIHFLNCDFRMIFMMDMMAGRQSWVLF